MHPPEKLIQFIWLHQLLNTGKLFTNKHERVYILYQGVHNLSDGPDFLNAKIKISKTIFIGSIEIHVNESEWYTHQHHKDYRYNNVVLHVCLKEGKPAKRKDGTMIPTVYIDALLPEKLLNKYEQLTRIKGDIPCHQRIDSVPAILINQWLTRLSIEKLEQKVHCFTHLFEQERLSWNQMMYMSVMRVFGGPQNADAFEEISRIVPIQLMIKHSSNLAQLEAMLLGVAGLIESNNSNQLREYNYLKKKYSLNEIRIPLNLLRIRPPARPVLRLKLFAHLIHRERAFIDFLFSLPTATAIKHAFKNTKHTSEQLNLSEELINLILINAVIPLVFFKSKFTQNVELQDQCVTMLNSIEAEENSIIKRWRMLKINAFDAAESQALLHLYKTYCNFKRCLDCQIGQTILNQID